ncbi:hypothetical protein IQ238_14100 [Pleurocapsales cyanobacterium LEGE 06147]|nr:hypothetical protein [Pleurocapsales cyanobacterium LEGE 06147]
MKDWRGRQRSKITFTDLLENDSSAVFAFNFLYFITRNLIYYFNQSNPHFNLGERFFGEFIGPLKLNLNGEDILYPPLYYKGAIGKKKDGSYVFGRLKVPSTGKVIIPIGDRNSHFRQEISNYIFKNNKIGASNIAPKRLIA